MNARFSPDSEFEPLTLAIKPLKDIQNQGSNRRNQMCVQPRIDANFQKRILRVWSFTEKTSSFAFIRVNSRLKNLWRNRIERLPMPSVAASFKALPNTPP
jgi:hypothetical protein